MNPKDLSLNSG